MKNLFINSIIWSCIILVAKFHNYAPENQLSDLNVSKSFKEIEKLYTDTIVVGDLNNDKLIDTAFITRPDYTDENDLFNCIDCSITVTFSGGFNKIQYASAVYANIENIGDIDGDGICEIILIPGWYVGCWGAMRFYTYKNNRWVYIDSARTRLCEEESFLPRIKKLNHTKIKVMEEVWDDDSGEIVLKPKIIRFNKQKK